MWTISWRSLFRNIHSRSNLWFDYISSTRWPTMPWARRPSRWWRGTSWPCSSPPTSPRSRARRGWTNQSLWQTWNQSWSWYVAQVLGQWPLQSLTKRIGKFALSRCVGGGLFLHPSIKRDSRVYERIVSRMTMQYLVRTMWMMGWGCMWKMPARPGESLRTLTRWKWSISINIKQH